MNGSETIFFGILKELINSFKRVVIDSETINGSVDIDEAVTAQILNKNQWRYQEKVPT